MKNLLGLLILMFVVNGNADEVRLQIAERPIQVPKNCYQHRQDGCALQTRKHEGFRLKQDAGEIRLDEDSIVIVDFQKKTLTLVQGWVWVLDSPDWKVRTEYGEARSDGSFWVNHGGNEMKILAYLSPVEVSSKLGEQFLVPSGQYNWLGRPTRLGRSSSGVPQPIPYYEQIARVARLFPDGPKELEEEIAAFAKTWKNAVKVASELSRENGERRIASVKEQMEREERYRQKVLRDREARRRLMFKKIYLDE